MSKSNGATQPNGHLSSRLVHALNHPLRIRILERLMNEDSSASRLAAAFGESVPTVSYHLCRVLFKECALVTIAERHQRRGAEERVFSLRREPFLQIVRFSTTAIVALEAEAGDNLEWAVCDWHSVAVDEQGQREINLAMEHLATTVRTVGERCAATDDGELHPLAVGTAAFEIVPSAVAQPRSAARQT